MPENHEGKLQQGKARAHAFMTSWAIEGPVEKEATRTGEGTFGIQSDVTHV